MITATESTVGARIPARSFDRCIAELGAPSKPVHAAVARDESLLLRAETSQLSTVRVWENGRALVVPSRLRERAACQIIDGDGAVWRLCARISGGGVVAHGPGTLNISLVVPHRGRVRLSIEQGYSLWSRLLDEAFHFAFGFGIAVGPAPTAFCPGEHDILLEGRKVAGVSQARRRGATLIHGTLLLNVDCAHYLEIVARGERLITDGRRGSPYQSETVISVQDVVGRPVSAHEIVGALTKAALPESITQQEVARSAQR